MKAELLGPISQAVATFAGAVFVLVGIWYRERIETSARAKNARIQIVAEIRALLDLIELNNYLVVTRDIIESIKTGGTRYLNFSSNRSFVSVYEANLQNLGHLDGSASEVVRFYMILLSSLEDKDMIVAMGSKFDQQRLKGEPINSIEFKVFLRQHESFLAKLTETIRIGEKICKDLGYRQPVPRKLRLLSVGKKKAHTNTTPDYEPLSVVMPPQVDRSEASPPQA